MIQVDVKNKCFMFKNNHRTEFSRAERAISYKLVKL